jgi:hypothetical protein
MIAATSTTDTVARLAVWLVWLDALSENPEPRAAQSVSLNEYWELALVELSRCAPQARA